MNIIIPYKPRVLQDQIHKALTRFTVLVCHRRFGKTVLTLNELIKEAVSSTKPMPRYAYIAPYSKQANRIAWDFLKYYVRNIPKKLIKINETNHWVEFKHNGARISLLGADNADALRGIYLDGVVLDEVGQMRPSVWQKVIRPTLADRERNEIKECWAIFIGTPNGRNMFFDLWENAAEEEYKELGWSRLMYKASQTDILDPEDLEAQKIELGMDAYAQEYECSFDAAIKGAYYGNLIADLEDAGQICSVPYHPELPVHTAWDIGIDDSTAIWFFQKERGGRINFIDYYEDQDEGIKWYAQVLQDKGYYYGQHWAPHDIEHREYGTGQSRLRTARQYGLNFKVVQKAPIPDGIHAARMLLPRCWFDIEKCGEGIEALRCYRKEYNEKLDAYKQKPRHDWASHAADAFRYFAVSYRDDTAGNFPQVGPLNPHYTEEGLPHLPGKPQYMNHKLIHGPIKRPRGGLIIPGRVI